MKTSNDAGAQTLPRVPRFIGLWGRRIGWWPHPSQLLGAEYDSAEAELLAGYVSSAPPTVPLLEPEECRTAPLLGGAAEELDASMRSDGVWIFPSDLAYYIRLGVRLPQQFLEHVRAADYRPPASVQWRFGDPADRGAYWVYWSMRNTRLSPPAVLHLMRSIVFLPLWWLIRPFQSILSRYFSLNK